MVQHPDQKGGIKGLADRVSSFSRRNPRRIAQAVLIIGGTLGLVLPFTLMKPSASDSVLILREKNGKIDANEAGKANKTYQTAQKRDVDKGLAISVFTSILLVGLIEPLALFIEYVATNSERKRFVQFFGRNSIEGDGMTAIFLTAEPKENAPDWITCPCKPTKAEGATVQGVKHVVPFEEVKAVLEIQRLFDRMGGSFDIDLDTACHNNNALPGHTVMAVGLGFNFATFLIQACSRSLFEIFYQEDESLGYITDDFKVNKSGHEDPGKVPGYDFALFARVFEKGILHFICAGRTATGTEAACRFLARKWTTLADQYAYDTGKGRHNINKDSMAVILKYEVNDLDNCEILHASFGAESQQS